MNQKFAIKFDTPITRPCGTLYLESPAIWPELSWIMAAQFLCINLLAYQSVYRVTMFVKIGLVLVTRLIRTCRLILGPDKRVSE